MFFPFLLPALLIKALHGCSDRIVNETHHNQSADASHKQQFQNLDCKTSDALFLWQGKTGTEYWRIMHQILRELARSKERNNVRNLELSDTEFSCELLRKLRFHLLPALLIKALHGCGSIINETRHNQTDDAPHTISGRFSKSLNAKPLMLCSCGRVNRNRVMA